jgi:hypothetical protein
MTKLTLPNRAATTVAAVMTACLFALACPLTALAAGAVKAPAKTRS